MAYYASRIASDDDIVWYVFCNNGACSDNSITAYCYPRTDNGSHAYPCIFLNCNLPKMHKVMPVIRVMIYSGYLHLWGYKNIIFYLHLTRRDNSGTLVDGNILPNLHPTATIAIEWRNNNSTIIHLALKEFFQKAFIVGVCRLLG